MPGRRPGGTLERLVAGEECLFEGSAFYRIRAGAGEIWKDAAQVHREYLEALSSPFSADRKELVPLRALADASTSGICYLDLETTGLRSAPLFLVGLMYSREDELTTDLLFARDYSEEAAVLRFVAQYLSLFSVLVTFNGAGFDLPFLADRMSYHGLSWELPVRHIDLLPLSRRIVGRRTPNHKLQTLEVNLLGLERIGDVPGRMIPQVYHEFVRTGDAGDIAGVIEHNRLDLLSMLRLVLLFLSGRV